MCEAEGRDSAPPYDPARRSTGGPARAAARRAPDGAADVRGPGAPAYIKGDHAELTVGGRLDVRSAADARVALHRAVDEGRGDLVLDLTDLDSWDATGLGVIMGAHRRAGRADRRLVLRGVPPQMQRLLVATKLHRILTIQ
jgi:anti-anti-sigma factor